MKSTSHFVGIGLKSEKLANIFVEVYDFLGENRTDIIEFQNPLSLHVTLYYFPKEIQELDMEKIEKLISQIELKKIHTKFGELNYFGKNIAYIGFENIETLQQINSRFKDNFPEYSNIRDNVYLSFIPHMTLFKIKNSHLYDIYRKEIEKIVGENLRNLEFHDSYDKISLYSVNSTFSPELQIIIK